MQRMSTSAIHAVPSHKRLTRFILERQLTRLTMAAVKAKFLQELEQTENRPEKESIPFWQKPMVKKIIQNVFVVAIGIGIGVLLPTRQPVKLKA